MQNMINKVKILAIHYYAEDLDHEEIAKNCREIYFILDQLTGIEFRKELGRHRITYRLIEPLCVTNDYLHLCMNVCEEILGPTTTLEVDEQILPQSYTVCDIATTTNLRECAWGNVVYLDEYISSKKKYTCEENQPWDELFPE